MASVINALIQSDISNITKAKNNCELWKIKLNKIRTTANDLAIHLSNLMDQQEALTHFLLAMDLQIQEFAHASRSSRNNKQLRKYFEKLEKTKSQRNTLALTVDQLLKDEVIAKANQHAKRRLEAQTAAAQVLNELQNKSPEWAQKFDGYFALLVNAGLVVPDLLGGKAFAGLASGALDTKKALNLAVTGAAIANDLASIIKEYREL